jgi:hypothetical protein
MCTGHVPKEGKCEVLSIIAEAADIWIVAWTDAGFHEEAGGVSTVPCTKG